MNLRFFWMRRDRYKLNYNYLWYMVVKELLSKLFQGTLSVVIWLTLEIVRGAGPERNYSCSVVGWFCCRLHSVSTSQAIMLIVRNSHAFGRASTKCRASTLFSASVVVLVWDCIAVKSQRVGSSVFACLGEPQIWHSLIEIVKTRYKV